MPAPSEKGSETSDDLVLDGVLDEVEVVGGSSPVEQGGLLLVDAYLQNSVRIEVFARFIPVKLEPRYWVAIFERSSIHFGALDTGVVARPSPPHLLGVERADNWQQQPMLVDVVDDPKRPQEGLMRIQQSSVYSAIRLCQFETVEDVEAAYSGIQLGVSEYPSTPLLFWAKGRISNRELRVLVRVSTRQQDELPGKMVEGGSKVVQAVSDHEGPIGVYLGNAVHPIDVVNALDLCIKGEVVSVGVKGIGDGLLEIGQVSVRPTKFLVNPAQIRHDT